MERDRSLSIVIESEVPSNDKNLAATANGSLPSWGRPEIGHSGTIQPRRNSMNRKINFIFRSVCIAALIVGFLALSVSSASAQVTVKFWHAMSGKRIKLLKDLSGDFEKSHPTKSACGA